MATLVEIRNVNHPGQVAARVTPRREYAAINGDFAPLGALTGHCDRCGQYSATDGRAWCNDCIDRREGTHDYAGAASGEAGPISVRVFNILGDIDTVILAGKGYHELSETHVTNLGWAVAYKHLVLAIWLDQHGPYISYAEGVW
jgi:hypothetical protein